MTISSDYKITLPPRQEAVIDHLRGKAFARVKDLAEVFGVDPMTIRRDLDRLYRLGFVERLHGGCRLSSRGTFDRAFAERERLHRTAKNSIGERAASLVAPGQLILIDSGTTPLAVARAIARKQIPNITLVTASLPVLWELYDNAELRVIALGGDLQRETGQLYGPLTENMLHSLNVDIAFMGADGIEPARGFAAVTQEVARLATVMYQIARRCIVVADGSKVGAFAPYVFAPLAGNMLITDRLRAKQRTLLKKADLLFEEVEK